MLTSGQSNLTKRPHRRPHGRFNQSYSSRGANVHPIQYMLH